MWKITAAIQRVTRVHLVIGKKNKWARWTLVITFSQDCECVWLSLTCIVVIKFLDDQITIMYSLFLYVFDTEYFIQSLKRIRYKLYKHYDSD